MELLKKEEPDEILMASMCKLWSQMQELTASRSDKRRQCLVELRKENDDRVLRFVIKLNQYHNAREATVDGAWSTKAFADLPGFHTYVDQCGSELKVPDDYGKSPKAAIREIKNKAISRRLRRTGDWERRLVLRLSNIKRLRKNLGSEILAKMLQAVQATENVIKAAKKYLCPSYDGLSKAWRSPDKRNRGQGHLLVDSAWINPEDGRKCVPATWARPQGMPSTGSSRPTSKEYYAVRCFLMRKTMMMS